MRRVSYAQFIKSMSEWSNTQELDEIRRLTSEEPPSWEEYEARGIRTGELVAKINGCQCTEDIQEQYRLVCGNFRQASGGNLELLQNFSHPSHDEHWRLNNLLAQKHGRERRCHSLKRGFVCYCDEHEHQDIL